MFHSQEGFYGERRDLEFGEGRGHVMLTLKVLQESMGSVRSRCRSEPTMERGQGFI